MSGGHAVVVPALRQYAQNLQGDTVIPGEVAGLVRQADVGDESWGLVGLVVKGTYTGMLTDLQDLLLQMSTGLTAASEKMTAAANAYQQHEDDSKAALDEILKLLEQPAPIRTKPPQLGPAN